MQSTAVEGELFERNFIFRNVQGHRELQWPPDVRSDCLVTNVGVLDRDVEVDLSLSTGEVETPALRTEPDIRQSTLRQREAGEIGAGGECCSRRLTVDGQFQAAERQSTRDVGRLGRHRDRVAFGEGRQTEIVFPLRIIAAGGRHGCGGRLETTCLDGERTVRPERRCEIDRGFSGEDVAQFGGHQSGKAAATFRRQGPAAVGCTCMGRIDGDRLFAVQRCDDLSGPVVQWPVPIDLYCQCRLAGSCRRCPATRLQAPDSRDRCAIGCRWGRRAAPRRHCCPVRRAASWSAGWR